MEWNEYIKLFDAILDGTNTEAPYDNPAYVEFVKLNKSRQNRWLKKGSLTEEMLESLASLKESQQWILITEPWCGDAAHSAPMIQLIAEASDKIELEIQLRDSEPHLINDHLTNGGKAIPKLVVRDANGNDLFVWGPRPKACQQLVMQQKEQDLTDQEKKTQQQAWYNKDKGVSIQNEFIQLLKSIPTEA